MSIPIVLSDTKIETRNLSRARGDTHELSFALQAPAGTAYDITGASFLLSVNSSEAPTGTTTQIFQMVGAIDGAATGGIVEFAPSTSDSDNVGEYYYDLQMKTSGGKYRTVARGSFAMIQDVTKGPESYTWTPDGTVGDELVNDGTAFWQYKNTNSLVAEQALVHRERDSVAVVANEGTNRNYDIAMAAIGSESPRQSWGPSGVWDFFVKWYGKDWTLYLEFYSGQNSDESVLQMYSSGEHGRFQIYGAVYPQGRGYTEYISEDDDQAFAEGWWKARFRVDFDNYELSSRIWDPAGAEPGTWNAQGSVLVPFWGAQAPLWLVINCDQTTGIFELAEFGWEYVES